MPTRDLRRLQRVIRERRRMLPMTEGGVYERSCLDEADGLIDEVVADLKTDLDRATIYRKAYRILILSGEGGAFGPMNEP